MGLTWEEVEASAQDRQTWRQRVALYASAMLDESSQVTRPNLGHFGDGIHSQSLD